jgi:hypothetical protein
MRPEKEDKKKEKELKEALKIVKLQKASLVSAADIETFLAYHNELVEAINDCNFTILKDVKKYEKLWKMVK